MKKAALILLFTGTVISSFCEVQAQPFKKPLNKRIQQRMDQDRKITKKDITKALRNRSARETLHTMGVLMRSYYDKNSAEDVAETLVKVLYCRFKTPTPKKAALENLSSIGPVGIIELEKALKSRLRRADPKLRIKAIQILTKAKCPTSWKVLLSMGRDSNKLVAIAAIKSLPNFTKIQRRNLCSMVKGLTLLMRPPTAEEQKKDLALPPLQKTIRLTLTQITGAPVQSLSHWKAYMRKWIHKGCPVANQKKKEPKKNPKSEVSATPDK